MFWRSIITNPVPNSTADKIRKKNVNERKLTLSYIKPIIMTMEYNVIHKNSAVSSKCTAVFTFNEILANKKKKINSRKFNSLNNIMY